MAKGKTKSKLNLSERKRMAARLILRGYNNADIATKLNVTWDTAARYREDFEKHAREYAKANPGFLRDILTNTIKSLAENDEIRAEAWKNYEEAETHSIKQGYLHIAHKAQQTRAQIFGVLGIKQEYFIHVQNVQIVQTKLFEFMRKHLCEKDRQKLEQFFTRELQEYLDADVTNQDMIVPGGEAAPVLPELPA